MYCRHCTRRQVVGVTDKAASRRDGGGYRYIREHKSRDVLISGGDPYPVNDTAGWILRA